MVTPPREPDLAKCDIMLTTCACLNLRKASRAMTQIFDESLRTSGLRSTQLPVLVTLALSGTITMSNLAEELVMDRTSLARLLRPLERGGYVEVVPGQDRRTRGVSLTESGQEAVAEAIPLWEKAQDYVVERMGRKRWRDLRENLSAATALVR
jgi:DNA-binding MarR family transcriptional regulator